jgi:hypothetical protein
LSQKISRSRHPAERRNDARVGSQLQPNIQNTVNDVGVTRPALPDVPVAARRRAQRLVRHPLLATALAAGDSRLDYEAFAEALLADLAPVGPLETTIATRAVGLAWRLNRAQALESAFLSKADGYGAGLTPIQNALDNRNDLAALEAMQRWETSLNRAFSRTLDQLRATQASRTVAKNSAIVAP